MALPRIVTSLTVRNTTADLAFSQSESFTGNEESSSVAVVTLTTSSTTVSAGTTANPKYFSFSNQSGDNKILIGFDGTNYDQEVAGGDMVLVRLRNSDKVEIQTAQTVADVSESLDGTYFIVNGETGSWAIWIDVGDSGTAAPAASTTSYAEITSVAADDTAAAVAAAIANDLQNNADFSIDFTVEYDATVDDDLITITDNFIGTRTDITANTSGFTVAKTQDGVATGRSVYAKSDSGEVEALISVMPN